MKWVPAIVNSLPSEIHQDLDEFHLPDLPNRTKQTTDQQHFDELDHIDTVLPTLKHCFCNGENTLGKISFLFFFFSVSHLFVKIHMYNREKYNNHVITCHIEESFFFISILPVFPY